MIRAYPIYKYLLYLTLAVMIGWTGWLYYRQDTTTVWNYLYNIGLSFIYAIGGAAAVAGLFENRYPSKIKRTLLYFAIGMAGWAVACGVWTYYNLALDVEVPFPSVADYFYYTYTFFIGFACWSLLSVLQIRLTFRRIIVPFVVTFILYVVSLFIFIWPVFSAKEPLIAIIEILHPVINTFVFVLGFVIFQHANEDIRPSLLYFVLGLFAHAIADVFFILLATYEQYWNGDLSDCLYVLSGFFISYGIIRLMKNWINETNVTNKTN